MSWTVANIEEYWVEYLNKDYKCLSTPEKKLRCLVNGVMLGREKVLKIVTELLLELKPEITEKLLNKVISESKGDSELIKRLLG